MRPPGRSSAAAALWPAAASGSNSRWPRAPCGGARRTCVPPRKYWLARTRIRGVAPRTNPPSLFSCAPHLQPTITGRQGRSRANNRWAIPEHQSGPIKNIETNMRLMLEFDPLRRYMCLPPLPGDDTGQQWAVDLTRTDSVSIELLIDQRSHQLTFAAAQHLQYK